MKIIKTLPLFEYIETMYGSKSNFANAMGVFPQGVQKWKNSITDGYTIYTPLRSIPQEDLINQPNYEMAASERNNFREKSFYAGTFFTSTVRDGDLYSDEKVIITRAVIIHPLTSERMNIRMSYYLDSTSADADVMPQNSDVPTHSFVVHLWQPHNPLSKIGDFEFINYAEGVLAMGISRWVDSQIEISKIPPMEDYDPDDDLE